MSVLRQQHRFFLSVLMVADLTIIVVAVVMAYALRFHVLAGVIPPKGEEFDYFTHAIPVELAAPIMMLAMLWAGAVWAFIGGFVLIIQAFLRRSA